MMKIFLYHPEWTDQAIINIEDMTIHRIKHTDQYGTFKYDDKNNIIINWNYWGEEFYIKQDDMTYFYETYKEPSIQNEVNVPIYIFIHICCIENWEYILSEQIKYLKESGLFEKADKIYLGILGPESVLKLPIFNLDIESKITILYIDSRYDLYEIHTINHIKYICSKINNEVNILYIHTKGVRKNGNDTVITSWRRMMEYFVIGCYLECIKNLNIYDTIG